MLVIWNSEGNVQLECMECRSILAISSSDLLPSEFHYNLTFKCPVCRTTNPVSWEIVEHLNKLRKYLK